MNINIPFSKEIVFKSNIAEITSISLEKDISINDTELLGDFIINGEYKNLDINVDTFPFNHVIPFSVNLDDDIDINTLSYDIFDFNYEIINDNILKVNILLHVEAEKNVVNIKDDIFDRPSDDDVADVNELIDDSIVDKVEDNKLVYDDNIKNAEDERNDLNINNDDVKIDIMNNQETNNVILNNSYDNDYITYHIHNVKLSETIESIASTYNISKDVILDINNIDKVEAGDKLIIPLNVDEK